MQKRMSAAMFRNIIWDVDGTLFDTYPAIARAFQAGLHDLGKEAALDWVAGLARISLSQCVTTLAGHYHLEEDTLGEAFEKYYDQVTPEQQPPFPGVIAICAYICGMGGKNVIVTHRGLGRYPGTARCAQYDPLLCRLPYPRGWLSQETPSGRI